MHSTESALLRVLSDIYSAIDKKQVTLLSLLDVSAAFDTVDQSILLERLSKSFGIGGMMYAWFRFYTLGRTHIIHQGSTVTDSELVRSGVPHGSVLGPLLYILCMADVSWLVEELELGVHLYADDVQLYVSGKSSIIVDLVNGTMQAISGI